MTIFLALGILGTLLILLSFVVDFDFLDFLPLITIGTFLGVLGWSSLILTSSGAATLISLTIGVVLSLIAAYGTKKAMDLLSKVDSGKFEGVENLIGQVAEVTMVGEGIIKIKTKLKGLPVQLSAEEDTPLKGEREGDIQLGDEVLIIQTLSPTKVLIKKI